MNKSDRGTRLDVRVAHVVTLGLAGFMLLHPTVSRAIDWTEQLLFPPGAGPVEYPSIAFAPEFNPGFPLILAHWVDGAALYDLKNGAYADNNNSDGDTGAYSSMVVDATGVVHVGYNADFRRRYAKRVNNVWTVTNIGDRNTGCYILGESLALDANNRPTIAAYEYCTGQILVRSFNGTIWDAFDDVIPEPGGPPSLQIAADGSLCMAYINGSGLRYARRVLGVWSIEPVAAGQAGAHPSLRLRSDGSPVIAFTATANGGSGTFLRVATKVGGSWQFENLELAGAMLGLSPDLRLGPQDLPRIVYASFLQALPGGPRDSSSDTR